MIDIPLSNIPNQALSIRLDNSFYEISLTAVGATELTAPFYNKDATTIAVTIVRDGVTIVSGQRAVAWFPLIPYHYLENGNFMFVSNSDDLPDYNQFGITQSLVYASPDELTALRGI